MMTDLFSSFDQASFNALMPSHIFLCINLILITLLQLTFWPSTNRTIMIMFMMKSTMMAQLNRSMSYHLKSLNNNISSIFMMIILLNLMGLVPYSFSISSHLIFTLSLGLPMWLSMILSSLHNFPKMFIAHLLPDGAPTWLNPFLVMIETTSISVRPLTLSFRLAANMSAGHIVLGLLSLYLASSLFTSSSITILLLMTSITYILFEMAICLIQAYIFCLLLSLYSNDHTH